MKPDDASVSNIRRRREHALAEPSSQYMERRHELRQAAAKVFRSKGYQAVRITDVAEQLGVDRATLYYYFGNKRELYLAVILEAVEDNVSRARAIAKGRRSATEKLRALSVTMMDAYERHFPYLFAYVQEDMRRIMTDGSEQACRLAELGKEYERIVEEVIDQGIGSGEFRSVQHPRLVAYLVIGAITSVHRWYKVGGELTGAGLGDLFATMVIDGLAVR